MRQKASSFQPVALSLTVIAALLRLAPHPPNFAPVGSVALFGGAKLRGWQAYMVPLLAMAVTDPLLSHLAGHPAYSWATPVIYACFLINVTLGRIFLRHSSSAGRIAPVVLIGSVQFFLLTNLYEWWAGVSLYAHTWAGLLACYEAALPFFGRTILGDLFYSSILFGAYAVLGRKLETNKPAAV